MCAGVQRTLDIFVISTLPDVPGQKTQTELVPTRTYVYCNWTHCIALTVLQARTSNTSAFQIFSSRSVHNRVLILRAAQFTHFSRVFLLSPFIPTWHCRYFLFCTVTQRTFLNNIFFSSSATNFLPKAGKDAENEFPPEQKLPWKHPNFGYWTRIRGKTMPQSVDVKKYYVTIETKLTENLSGWLKIPRLAKGVQRAA